MCVWFGYCVLNSGFFFFFFDSNRKDSFITHRAFCDALAEESARLTSVAAATNLNFRNDNNVNNLIPHGFAAGRGVQDVGGNNIPQFGTGFAQDFNGMSTTGIN